MYRSRLVDISPWFAAHFGTSKDYEAHLPLGWKEVAVSGGKVIYVNAATNEVMGARPATSPLSDPPSVPQKAAFPLQDVTHDEFSAFLTILYSR